ARAIAQPDIRRRGVGGAGARRGVPAGIGKTPLGRGAGNVVAGVASRYLRGGGTRISKVLPSRTTRKSGPSKPTQARRKRRRKVSGESALSPSTAAIRSPACRPALAKGLAASAHFTRTPAEEASTVTPSCAGSKKFTKPSGLASSSVILQFRTIQPLAK